MLKSVEDINATKKRLRIEIPSDVIEQEIKNSLENLRQRAKIPGFRPGKAPVSLIEKRFGKEVEGEVLEKIIPEQLGGAIREAALNPITMPVLEEEFRFTRNNPIALSVIVEVMPKIENIDYEKISVKEIPGDVGEADVEDTLKKLREQKAVYEVADKEIETDDFVSFEYAESEIEGQDSPAVKEIVTKMGNEIFPPDLMEKVIGKKKGYIIEFTKTFDEALSKELAGKTANIKVTISEVKKKTLPALDDDFAKDLGYGNLAELREKLKERIYTAKKEQIRKIQKAQVINELIDTYPIEVPESLLQRELDNLMLQENLDNKEHAKQAAASAQDDSEAAPTAEVPEEKKEEDPHVKLRERALRSVQASIIVNTIGQKEGVTVSDNEVEERISSLAQRLSATPEAVRSFYEYQGGSMDNLKQSIFQDKVMDILLSKAVIEKESKETETKENK